MKSVFARSGFVTGFAIAATISFFICVLVWSGILFQFAQAIGGALGFSTIDLTPPNSLKELTSGLILGIFLSFAVSIFLIPFCLAARRRWNTKIAGADRSYPNPDAGYGFVRGVLACAFVAITFGGLLVFLVPSWIGAVALLVGATVAIVATKGM